jgi:glucose/arabinose dehydrogenase
MFISEYGGGGPPTGSDQEVTGFRVVRADLDTRQVTDFLANRRPVYGTTGPVRPVDVKFDPSGEVLYVLDWGFLSGSMAGLIPWAQSGILWRVYPTG